MGLNANINEIEKPRENPGEGRDILGPAADSGQQVNQQTSKDRTFELYSINFFPADFPLSHRSVLLAQIINYEKHLKTTASPSQETDSRQPKRLYTLSYLLKNDKKQTENNEGDQFAAGHQKQMKRPRKPSNHSPTKRRRSATVTHDVRDRKMENHPTPPDGFLPKAVAPEVMHRAGAGAPPNQLGSPTDDFAQGGLIPKPGSNSLGGTKTCSAADPKVPAMSSPGAVPNIPQVSPAMAKKINDDIKYQLMKEVRKFGRKYERIFTLLEEVRGPLAVKKQFVEFTIKEAARFKRGVLIQQLEKVLEKIESCRCLKKVNHQKSK